MKIYFYNEKLVEEVGGFEDPGVFLNVLKDEDRDKCPHCGKPIPTEITVITSSPNYKNGTRPVATLPSTGEVGSTKLNPPHHPYSPNTT